MPIRNSMINAQPWKAFPRSLSRAQAGFTLMEMTIAVTISMVIFLAGAAALVAMMTASTQSRLKQHATEVVTEAIEATRGVDYRSLMMKDQGDLATLAASTTPARSRLGGTPGAYTFDPDGTASQFAPEAIVAATTGGAIDPLEIVDRNGAKYTVRTYVTVPIVGASATTLLYRRVTVHVDWVQNGQNFHRTSSTFVTDTRRGLPLPNFSVTGKQTGLAVSAGQQLALRLRLTNNGARDRWTFSESNAAGWTFTWYRDTDNSGSFDIAVDQPITDTDGSGAPDSGALETDQSVLYFGLTTVPNAAAAGTVAVTFTATAVSNTTVSRSMTHTVSVISTTCSLCTWKKYWLRNGNPKKVLVSSYTPTPAPANPNEATIETDPPVLGTLYDFDSGDANSEGRELQRTSNGNSETDVRKIIGWRYVYPAKTYQKSGNVGALRVWARPSGGAAGTVGLRAYLYRPSGSGGPATVIATGALAHPFTALDAGSFSEFVIPLVVVTTESVNATKPLEFRLVAENATSTVDALIAYDTTTYPAHIVLPESLT